jgi:glycosyltransferase involved in cell wall biosynthesis
MKINKSFCGGSRGVVFSKRTPLAAGGKNRMKQEDGEFNTGNPRGLPLVSILIPVYNAEKWLGEAVHSVLTQTWPHREIIIVDDGSGDRSLEIARSFEPRGVKVFHQGNAGGSSARNKAFRESRGEYIQYLDADDTLAPEKIDVQIKRLAVEPPGTVASGAYGRFTRHIDEADFLPDPGWGDYEVPLDWLLKAGQGQTMFPPAVWLTPRHIIETAGPWNEELTYNDDLEFFTRVLLKSGKIAFCPDAKSFYRTGNILSLGSRKDPAALASALKCWQLFTRRVLEADNSEFTTLSCAEAFQGFIFSIYPAYPELRKIAREELHKLGITRPRYRRYSESGRVSGFFSRILGWKASKWLRYLYYKLKIIPGRNKEE